MGTTNNGKYIIPFAITVLLLNIVLIVFLYLYDKGIVKLNNTNEIETVVEVEVESFPVSSPV